MKQELIKSFLWFDIDRQAFGLLNDEEKYQKITNWASLARGKNPNVFDAVTAWVLDDSEWIEDKLAVNEQTLIQGIIARFKDQNAQLRMHLKALEPSGLVNLAVFNALDRFDDELSGNTHSAVLNEAVANMFADFSVMSDKSIRKLIAGNKTGPSGTNSVDIFGYINTLKDCDAGVQWALFMPDVVKRQQNGFKVQSFEYKKMPALRFIGREGEELSRIEVRKELFQTLDTLSEFKTEFSYDILFMHHFGLGVDVGEGHGFWGRFMKADTPVPEGFAFFDFIPHNDGKAGPPYISQFAFAVFSGDMDSMHKAEGFDCDAMYDITRNIMLAQGVNIPYPFKYWTAEVFLEGFDKQSTAYMFSAEL